MTIKEKNAEKVEKKQENRKRQTVGNVSFNNNNN